MLPFGCVSVSQGLRDSKMYGCSAWLPSSLAYFSQRLWIMLIICAWQTGEDKPTLQILVFFTRMQSIWSDLVVALSVCGWTAGRAAQKHFHFCERYQHGTHWDSVWLILIILVDMENGEGSISSRLAGLLTAFHILSQNKAWLLSPASGRKVSQGQMID